MNGKRSRKIDNNDYSNGKEDILKYCFSGRQENIQMDLCIAVTKIARECERTKADRTERVPHCDVHRESAAAAYYYWEALDVILARFTVWLNSFYFDLVFFSIARLCICLFFFLHTPKHRIDTSHYRRSHSLTSYRHIDKATKLN